MILGSSLSDYFTQKEEEEEEENKRWVDVFYHLNYCKKGQKKHLNTFSYSIKLKQHNTYFQFCLLITDACKPFLSM